jgi:hypothetical protein
MQSKGGKSAMKSLRRSSDRWMVWLLVGNLSFMVANAILLYKNLGLQERFDAVVTIFEMGLRSREDRIHSL